MDDRSTEPSFTPLGDICKEHARLLGAKHAVTSGKVTISYSKLEDRSSEICKLLVSYLDNEVAGVCVLARKSPHVVPVVLGIWKAGAVFIPIDGSGAIERIRYQLRLLCPRIIICDRGHLDRVLSIANRRSVVLELDLDGGIALARDAERSFMGGRPPPPITRNTAAYCIFTSGSTGRPKGVTISHGSAYRFLASTSKWAYPVDVRSRCLNTAPFHFDVFLYDIFIPLFCGATVEVFCEIPSSERFLDVLQRKQITHFVAVAPMLTLICSGPTFEGRQLHDLERIVTGAEVLNVRTVERWLGKVAGLTLVNGYGPTEVTCACISHEIRTLEPGRTAPYPIGVAHEGVQIRLVGPNGRRVTKAGAIGELLAGGEQVMIGYWGRPGMSRRKIQVIDGVRYYKTGDLCFRDETGEYHFVGRKDAEIKVSGFRIHPNEVIRSTKSLPFVQQCELVVSETGERGCRLLMLVVAPKLLVSAELQERLKATWRSELARYMRPDACVVLDHFPLSSNGKIDRKALLDHAVEALRANRAIRMSSSAPR